jgi:DNA-binding NtrC family response regulator
MNFNKDLNIFVIDDDPVCQELYKHYLSNMGFTRISLFDNGQQCINELTRKPDIILLDHQMAPLNGMETLKKIKRFDPEIYLIYISAQKDMKVAIDALKYGAFDYIIKGNMEEELPGTIIHKIIDVMELVSKKTPGRINRFFSLFSL